MKLRTAFEKSGVQTRRITVISGNENKLILSFGGHNIKQQKNQKNRSITNFQKLVVIKTSTALKKHCFQTKKLQYPHIKLLFKKLAGFDSHKSMQGTN